ncbi:HD domain-containing protein [Spirosoma spitsbergense]|uniref:HD domain-containing protein n=1 Tax=Spirosoma spitsbergense TaxID=431554 RepID=UPI000370F203|nr:ATP-binding protein [Spirosoma spitsbergense]
MINNTLSSKAEREAMKAEDLTAFGGIKLLHIKSQLTIILNQIGRGGIFDEYTKHDISHINYMLDSLDWIIPERTQNIMTPADWLMIVLSIYFHDLGMLVTKDEFNKREKSNFTTFKDEIERGLYGNTFRDKINSIKDTDRKERFIYQELVRRTHAERIKYWILDENNPNFESANEIASEIKNLIGSLSYMFRRDLAYVCESHHLSDLNNLEKYQLNQPYGSLQGEEVNLHYASLILRTADLLHITSDRTPTVEYRLINPSDPISQDEWAKQKAVTKVRPQSKKNKDGKIDNTLDKDTFEVVAFFEDENGYFGLISYLNYADNELKNNYRFHEIAKQVAVSSYEYPWKHINDSGIQTKDFDKRQFEFVLDQNKILDLLVGHTLYNNQAVVLRELIQNSIDASRLKEYQLKHKGIDYNPEIIIDWDLSNRTLSFIDNGTGMNMEIIQNHLLKVGSSRYQDENFKKEFPNFSPISRFGIGLLTCFLIADDMDIITRTEDTDRAILLKIRKVHGKYLLKYLDAAKTKEIIPTHGTIVKLYVRSDVNLSRIEKEVKMWITIPSCKVTLNNDGEEIKIGYLSPTDVINKYLESIGYNLNEGKVKVVEKSINGIQLAYALKYIDHFKEWDFLDYKERNDVNNFAVGICVEGIKVDFNTPGFIDKNLVSICNITGVNAPKTDVARSNIEFSGESEILYRTLYEIYLQHFQEEFNNLRKSNFSISWAAKEINYLLNIFAKSDNSPNRDSRIQYKVAFDEALANSNFILVEKNKIREVINLNMMIRENHFWTIDSASYMSANQLVKEAKNSNTSALSLMTTLFGNDEAQINHINNLLCSLNFYSVINEMILNIFQVDAIKIIPEQRRLDLRWSVIKDRKIWKRVSLDNNRRFGVGTNFFIQMVDLELPFESQQNVINSDKYFFILNNSEIHPYLVSLINKYALIKSTGEVILSLVCSIISEVYKSKSSDRSQVEETINSFERKELRGRNISRTIWNEIDKDELIDVLSRTIFIKYDITLWSRKDEPFNDDLPF